MSKIWQLAFGDVLSTGKGVFSVPDQAEETQSDFLRRIMQTYRDAVRPGAAAPLAAPSGMRLDQDSHRSYISSQLWPMYVGKLCRLALINMAKHQEVKCQTRSLFPLLDSGLLGSPSHVNP